MPKLLNKTPKERRMGLSLEPELYNKIAILAELEKEPPAAFVRQILVEYADARAGKIEKAMRVAEAYRKKLEGIRNEDAMSDSEV